METDRKPGGHRGRIIDRIVMVLSILGALLIFTSLFVTSGLTRTNKVKKIAISNGLVGFHRNSLTILQTPLRLVLSNRSGQWVSRGGDRGRIIDLIVMGASILGALKGKDTMCKIEQNRTKRLGV